MKRQLASNPVTVVRALADSAEQVAHHLHRTVAAVKAMANDGRSMAHEIRDLYALVSPIFPWRKL